MWSHFSRPACCYSFVGKRYSLLISSLVSSRPVSSLSPFLPFFFYLLFSLSYLPLRCSTSTFSDEPRYVWFRFVSNNRPRSLSRIYFCIHSCNRASYWISLQTVRVLNCALQRRTVSTARIYKCDLCARARARTVSNNRPILIVILPPYSFLPPSLPLPLTETPARFYATRYEF